MKFASLCVLAYKRPQLLHECLESIFSTIDYPCEIIVNLDANDSPTQPEMVSYLTALLTQQKISKLILNNGKNRGVGRSFQNCLGVAEGDYIFKIDTDLTFQPRWLSTAIKILDQDSTVGAVGLFDYNKWDPNDPRFKPEENIIKPMRSWDFEYDIVKDFVSSIYGFRRIDFNQNDWLEVPDDGLHQSFGTMAMKHMVTNTAFGVNKSTYVSGTEDHPVKTATFQEPLLFGEK